MEESKRKNSYKSYEDQNTVRLSEVLHHYVPAGHLSWYVNEAVDQLDLSSLYAAYTGGGNSSYHPKLLLKCLIYGYLTQVYSSRRLKALMRENIMVKWLCSGVVIDHNTLNNFRKGHLKADMEEVFNGVLKYLIGKKVIKLEQMHTDGSECESLYVRLRQKCE
jgi:transposase